MTPSHSTPLAPEYVALILPRARLASLDILVSPPDVQHTGSTAQHQAVTADERQICLQISVSQLVLLEGTSIDGISPGETDRIRISGLPDLRLSRKGGRRVKTACINCRNVGKRCDAGRPCSRCKKMGLHGCRDAPSKAKKATSKQMVSELAPDYPQPAAGPSTTMDEAPHASPVGAVSPAHHIVPETMDASTHFWDPSSRYPTSNTRMPEALINPSTFDAGDMGQMPAYGYFDPAQAHVSQLVQTSPSPPVHAITGYPGTHQPSIHTGVPQGYFLYDVASGSDQNLGFETHPSSQSPAAGFQSPGWGQGW